MLKRESVSSTIYDARGHGGGQTVNTIAGDHQSRITDYTAIAVQGGDCMSGDNAIVRRLTPV